MRPEADVLRARQVLRATERAMGRAAIAAHEDLKHGLNTLATLTSIAPFVGVFGTVRAIGFDTVQEITPEEWATVEGEPVTPKYAKAREDFISEGVNRKPPKPVEEVPPTEPPVPEPMASGRAERSWPYSATRIKVRQTG